MSVSLGTTTDLVPGAGRLARCIARLTAAGMISLMCSTDTQAAEPTARFDADVRPVLEAYCYGCHGQGAKKGGVALDAAARRDGRLWLAVLKNL